MQDLLSLTDFLDPLDLFVLSDDEQYKEGQIGRSILIYQDLFPDLETIDMVLVGCGEQRGSNLKAEAVAGPDKVRRQFYSLYYWHEDVRLADLGNIKTGATLNDTYAALKTVIRELISFGKTVIILGGSHDLTLAQYYAYAESNKIIEAACVDARLDLDSETMKASENFLMEMLTGEPNYIRHYNHIGFQSYFVHPQVLQSMDKLRFDCYRTGQVRDNMEEMEPVIRNCELFSFDISAIAHAFAPSNGISPNGFNGEEACVLMQQAGLSTNVSTIGVYGYSADQDEGDLTAMQISQMLWYALDGRSRGKREASLDERNAFNEYHIAFAEIRTSFLQSKRTGRWWMQLPDKTFIACSQYDYVLASRNEIPERWLRAQERS